MKKMLFFTGLVLPFICCFHLPAFCQIDPATNAFPDAMNSGHNRQSGNGHAKPVAGISCDSNTFWAVNNTYQEIEEFRIAGDTIISMGIIATVVPGSSLAVCNNLNGGSVNPTFYTSAGNNDSIAFWNGGTSWITDPVASPIKTYNAAGFGNYLYFQYNKFPYFPYKLS